MSSTPRKFPLWPMVFVGTSLILLSLSMGLIGVDRSQPEGGAIRAEAPIGAGRAAGVGVAAAGEDRKLDSTPADSQDAWSKWGSNETDDPTWAGAAKWDDTSEMGELTSLDCVIEPAEVVSIGAPVSGMIEAIHFERSDNVEAGDVLVELESGAERTTADLARTKAKLNAELKSREAMLELSKRRSERAKKLYASNALSLDVREEIDTEAELARLELQRADDDHLLAELEHRQALERLKRRTIRSPISGVIIERLMSPGEVVDDEVILRLAQIDPLRVEIVLPAASFGSIHPGAKVAVIPEIPGDQVQMATVTIVDRVIDAASGTFGARLELPNPEGSIPSGLHCQVRFLDE